MKLYIVLVISALLVLEGCVAKDEWKAGGHTRTSSSSDDKKYQRPQEPARGAGLYVWRNKFNLESKTEVSNLVNCIKQKHTGRPPIKTVLLNIFKKGVTTYAPSHLAATVTALRHAGVKHVYALMTTAQAKHVKTYHAALAKMKNGHSGKFDGIALNYEGLASDSSPSQAKAVLSVFTETHAEAKKLGLKFHASLGHWYEHTHPEFFKSLVAMCDTLDLQAYNNKPRYARAAVVPELNKIKAMKGKKPHVFIGVETANTGAVIENWAIIGEDQMWKYVSKEFAGLHEHDIMIHYYNNNFCSGTKLWPGPGKK